MFTPSRLARIALGSLVTLAFALLASADEDDLERELAKVTEELTRPKYSLRYSYTAGETLRYRVEHVATVETRIQGTQQTSKSRSESRKAWRVVSVDPQEKSMEFEHRIESVDMWSVVTGREPVTYKSARDEKPPEQYANVAESLNVLLSRVKMDESGRVLERQDFIPRMELGMGGLSIPLPEGEVEVGHKWTSPLELKVKDRDGLVVRVKTRQLFELEKVSAGLATISLKTQVLTPLTDAAVRSQLVQRLSNGTIKFDLDTGRIQSRQLDWDETVIGFNGPSSNMKYLARLIETLETDQQPSKVASKPSEPRS